MDKAMEAGMYTEMFWVKDFWNSKLSIFTFHNRLFYLLFSFSSHILPYLSFLFSSLLFIYTFYLTVLFYSCSILYFSSLGFLKQCSLFFLISSHLVYRILCVSHFLDSLSFLFSPNYWLYLSLSFKLIFSFIFAYTVSNLIFFLSFIYTS